MWSAHKTNDTRACASGVRAEKLEDGGHHALCTHSTTSVFGAHAEDDNDTIAKATANVMVQDNEGKKLSKNVLVDGEGLAEAYRHRSGELGGSGRR